MNKESALALTLLRVVLGWMYFYAGITKLLNPAWSAAGYISGAKTFPAFYQWLLSPQVLPVVNFLNEWGLTLLGAALILGVFVRLGSVLGIILMFLYYLPLLDGVYPNAHSFIVDEHIVYIAALGVLFAFRAGRYYGLERWCSNLPLCSKFPKLRALLG